MFRKLYCLRVALTFQEFINRLKDSLFQNKETAHRKDSLNLIENIS